MVSISVIAPLFTLSRTATIVMVPSALVITASAAVSPNRGLAMSQR
jgi:hypothetical protein